MAEYTNQSQADNSSNNLSDITYIIEIATYIRTIIMVVGIIGNSMAIAVFSKLLRKNTRGSFGMEYFLIMAIMDVTFILFNFTLLTDKLDIPKEITNYMCPAVYYIKRGAQIYSAWILAALSIDRLLVVSKPLKYDVFCSKRRKVLILCVLAIVAFGYNTIQFWIVSSSSYSTCALFRPKISLFRTDSWIRLVIYALIPSAIIFTSNIKLIHATRENYGATTRSGKQKMVTRLLVLASLFFMVLTVSWSIIFIYNVIHPDNSQVIRAYSSILTFVNHGGNFFIYVLSGSKFRSELKKLFCPKRLRTKQNGKKLDYKTDLQKYQETTVSNIL